MMQKKKVLFVATVVKTHMMQFHIPYLKSVSFGLRLSGHRTIVADRYSVRIFLHYFFRLITPYKALLLHRRCLKSALLC